MFKIPSLFCAIMLFYFNFSVAQGINKYINLSSFTYSDINNILIENDTIITYGVAIIKEGNKYRQGILLSKIDSSGIIIKQNFILDSIGKSLSLTWHYGNFIKNSNGGYMCICPVVENDDVWLIKLGSNLETIWIKVYSDPAYLSNFDYKILEVNDGFLLYGSIQYPPKPPSKNGQVVGFVRRIDEEGNQIWVKEFKPSPYLNDIADLKIINDSTYTFLLNSEIVSDIFDPVVFHSLYVINDKGSTIKSWRTKNSDPNYWYIDKLVAADNAEILVFGHKFIDYYFQNDWQKDRNFQPYIAAFDTKTLAPKWQKYIGIKSNADFVYNGLNDFVKTKDDNYIGVGNMGHSDYLVTDDSKLFTWLNKFSPQGDEIWSRKIELPSNLPDSIKLKDREAGFLNSVGVLSSGSVIAAGYVWVGKSTYSYLVKMTNDGCLDTLFKCGKTTEVNEENIDNQGVITIFPNPASDMVYVKFKENPKGCSVLLKDLNGKILLTEKIDAIQLETVIPLSIIANGLYLVEIQSFGGQSSFHKLIIVH